MLLTVTASWEVWPLLFSLSILTQMSPIRRDANCDQEGVEISGSWLEEGGGEAELTTDTTAKCLCPFPP